MEEDALLTGDPGERRAPRASPKRVDVTTEEDGDRHRCPRRRGAMLVLWRCCGQELMLGPQWHLLLITYAVVLTVSICVDGWVLSSRHTTERVVGWILTGFVLACLTALGLGDPGVVHTHAAPVGDFSSYCDTCRSFRPIGAIHCNDCQVCVAGYDHHCPWSSKCIGAKNMVFFNLFLGLLFILMVYDGIEIALLLAKG
uniref:Palmitoyltransferase n=1 Tax=Rhizochromulina marina TaxID=1034831 RepID=A0A7S2WG88_9STRA|mmetsp:Transcript_23163/g.67544  ORF Transcript_23163/g.67544 Transcript_23163/m.67544 type:complete len:199 (+) Transcript_23163:134-730(+)